MATFVQVVKHVWTVVRNYKITFFYTFISFGIGIGISDLYLPVLLQQIIDIASGEVVGDIWRVAWIFIGVLIAINIIFRTYDIAMMYVQRMIMRDLSRYAFSKLIDHSYTFFSNEFVGSLVAKTTRFRHAFGTIHDDILYRLWAAVIILVGSSIILFQKNSFLGLLFVAFNILYLIITLVFVKFKVPLDEKVATADSKVTARLADTLSNVHIVQMFSRKKYERETYDQITHEQERALAKNWNFSVAQWATQAVLLLLLEIFTLYFSIKLWQTGKITVGTIVLVQSFLAIIFSTVWNLGRALTNIAAGLSDMKELVDILDTPFDIKDPKKSKVSKLRRSDISLNNVTFQYEGNPPVLKEFSLTIPVGQRVGLVGPSGAGKSTVTKLLLRFVDVIEGKVQIGKVDIREIQQDTLRSSIAYVPQDPVLFHRTLAQNIAYGNPKASQKQIVQAAKKARAHEFISKLPQGYHTLVGERGIKLSGGERQRIAIARAMLKNAPILILDEATSSLDTISEKLIQEALTELMKGKTTIVIAHRLSTVRRMDRIIVMHEGKILEDGSHKSLLRKKGLYHKLYTQQKL